MNGIGSGGGFSPAPLGETCAMSIPDPPTAVRRDSASTEARAGGPAPRRARPCSSRDPAGRRARWPPASDRRARSSPSSSTTLPATSLLAALAIGLGFLLVDVAPADPRRSGTPTSRQRLARPHRSSAQRRLLRRLVDRRHPVHPGARDPVRRSARRSLRRWRVGGLIVGAILVEVATYRVASLIVHRERPRVPRLDHLPVNQSYPVRARRGVGRRLRRARAAALARTSARRLADR